MRKFRVHLREKRIGEIEVDAADSFEATALVKRMIQKGELPRTAMGPDTGIRVTFAEELT